MKYSKKLGEWLYEVGDQVRVIDSPYKNHGTLGWHPEMKKFCGKLVIISKVDEYDGTYQIEGNDYFWWCNDFFETYGFLNEDDQNDEEFNIDVHDFLGSFVVRS